MSAGTVLERAAALLLAAANEAGVQGLTGTAGYLRTLAAGLGAMEWTLAGAAERAERHRDSLRRLTSGARLEANSRARGEDAADLADRVADALRALAKEGRPPSAEEAPG